MHNCWVKWASELHELMMANRLLAVTKRTADIHQESGTSQSLDDLQQPGFWNSCRREVQDWDTIFKAGLVIDFAPNEHERVETVTFRLDKVSRARLRRA